jgi:hypothetical protein
VERRRAERRLPGDLRARSPRWQAIDYKDTPEITTQRHMLMLWLQMPTWPPLPINQACRARPTTPLQLRQRTPFMGMPTRYLAETTRRKAELANTVL